MTKLLQAACIGAILLSAAGCAPNALVSSNTMRTGRAFGDYGIKGNGNKVTVENGSMIVKLSIWGDRNEVMLEDDVGLAQIEIMGSNNIVSLPEGRDVRVTQWGKGNRIEYRPAPWRSNPYSTSGTLPPARTEVTTYNVQPSTTTTVVTTPAGASTTGTSGTSSSTVTPAQPTERTSPGDGQAVP